MSDELMEAAAKNKGGRPPKHPVNIPAGTELAPPTKEEEANVLQVDPAGPTEMEMLKQQNADLMKMVMEMRAMMFPDPAAENLKKAEEFDKKKPFQKIRGMGVGVYYIQNNRRYNGKFELVDTPATA